MELSNMSKYMRLLSIYSILLLFQLFSNAKGEQEEPQTQQKFKIDGKVVIPFTPSGDQEWLTNTRVLINGGQYMGFLRADGSFTVSNVPSGSYVVEVSHPVYLFEPSRVDITSKGKIRARKLDNIRTNAVHTITYPLKFKARAKANYFQVREQWRITDMLMSPMVIMMLLPVVMVMILPRLINPNDPETQKEMQQQMKMLNPKQNMPEMSELLTSWLGGGAPKQKAAKPKPARRR